MTMKRLLGSMAACIAFGNVALAQPAAPDSRKAPVTEGDKKGEKAALEQQLEDLAKRVTAAEKKDEQKEKENEQLRKQLGEVQSRLKAIEEEDSASLQTEDIEEFKPNLNIYGFMSMGFFHFALSKGAQPYGITPNKPSFAQSELNLYFSGHMEKTLSALAEIRFTYMPNGTEKSFGIPPLGLKYERTNTEVFNPVSGEKLFLHGLSIERAIFTWTPYDFLGITAGRFITPFGIWNIDHSPTEVIPVRAPYLVTWQTMPLKQTGIEIFGRFFPFARSYLDYAVTLSNGRGSTEEIYDLDNNKAVGFRLQASYDNDDYGVTLGSYLYYGKVTDVTKNFNVGKENNIVITPIERYNELVESLDLSIRIAGLRLQSEYVHGLAKYSIRPLRQYEVINIPNVDGIYQPDYIDWEFYGLASYEIKLASGKMSLTPFGLYEYYVFESAFPGILVTMMSGGLNFKPSPYVVIKYEGKYVNFSGDNHNSNKVKVVRRGFWTNYFEVAVSF